ncbi:MAG: hypothetical protein JRC90_11895 [Deltaproteobacteria bacterium]|nr:hypothetical protein [Deltaproteobacteria bacterium]
MPTYDDFIAEANSFRAKLLRDRAYKRLDIAKQTWDNVRATISYILNQLQSLIGYEARYNVHRYSIETYLASKANQIGEKAVKASYADSTEIVDSYEVPSYARFSYDETLDQEKRKEFTVEFMKQHMLFAIDLTYSPPTGDVEDTKFAYYFAEDVVHEPYTSETNIFGELPRIWDVGAFGVEIKKYTVYGVEGEMVMIDRTIDGQLVEGIIFFNPIAVVQDPDTNEQYKQNLKYYIHILNYSSYPINLCVFGHKFYCDAGYRYRYVVMQEVKVYPNPAVIKIESL